MFRRSWFIAAVALVLMLVLSACGQGTSTEEANPVTAASAAPASTTETSIQIAEQVSLKQAPPSLTALGVVQVPLPSAAQVRTHVRGFGENAAADPGKQGNGTGSQRKSVNVADIRQTLPGEQIRIQPETYNYGAGNTKHHP